jgi:hypothetical protein
MYKQWVIGSALFVSSLVGGEFEMILSEEEKSVITEIITFVGDVEDGELMKATEQLAPKLMKIMAASPLQIIGHIALDRDLSESLLKASESPLKWGVLVRGFSMRMNQEALSDGFEQKMEDFLRFLSLEGNGVEGYIEKKEWGNFIITLLQNIER